MFETLILTAKILLWPLGLAITGLILLQGGAGDISSAFGGGGQIDSSFGVGAGRKLAKLTGGLAVAFIVLVLFLAIRPPGTITATNKAGNDNHGATLTSAPGATVTAPAPGTAPTQSVVPTTPPK